MISHRHKCIFIHIPKCAGSSIETAFGIDVNSNVLNKTNLFGWDESNRIYLQHATPQELLDFDLISRSHWESYYKFIIVRNTWDKLMSDYFWFKQTKNVKGSFEDFLFLNNEFEKFNKKGDVNFRGDHLNFQKDYMFLDSKKINYDKIIFFDKYYLDEKLIEVASDLNLPELFFQKKIQVSKKFKSHYSKYYSDKMIRLVSEKYHKDIEYFNFSFEDKRGIIDFFRLMLN